MQKILMAIGLDKISLKTTNTTSMMMKLGLAIIYYYHGKSNFNILTVDFN